MVRPVRWNNEDSVMARKLPHNALMALICGATCSLTAVADCPPAAFEFITRPSVGHITNWHMSRDAQAMVGSTSYYFDGKDFREIAWVWRKGAGYSYPLGDGYYPNWSTFTAINNDGSAMGSLLYDENTYDGSFGTVQDGLDPVPAVFDGIFSSDVISVSDDGLTAVVNYGYASTEGPSGNSAVVVHPDRSTTDIGHINEKITFSLAHSASADCSVICGISMVRSTPFPRIFNAFRWTEATGIQELGLLDPADQRSEAWHVSADGTSIVGYSSADDRGTNAKPFRWTEADGMQPLPVLPESRSSRPISQNADGSLIGGFMVPEASGNSEAVLWDDANGIRRVQDMLIDDYGIDSVAMGWKLHSIRQISDDGRTLVGSGRYRSFAFTPFVINLDGQGGVLYMGDINNDSRIDTADLGVMISKFGAAASEIEYDKHADLNLDGVIDTADLGMLMRVFGGSPCE